MTEIATLTRIGVLPNPAFLRYSFWISSYPGILLKRPNTLLQPQQEPRHQARRYRSWLSTSAHIPQRPAPCEETFVKCAFYYSILCWKKNNARAAISNDEKNLFCFTRFDLCCCISHAGGNPILAACVFSRFIWCEGDLGDLLPLLAFPMIYISSFSFLFGETSKAGCSEHSLQ